MTKFIKRILLFSLPISMYIVLLLCIDPYNVLKKENNQRLITLKSQVSKQVNYPLYKLQNFSNHPTDIILLGDSRTDLLDSKVIDSITQIPSSNLAYAGGTLPEIIESFWQVTEVHDFKQVYIGMNFNLYNAKNSMNRVTGAVHLKNSPISYLFSKPCIKATTLILKSIITGKTVNLHKPNLNKEEFWKYQLETSANNFYQNYEYPKNYYLSLLEISEYCKDKNITLVFFVPPTHTDLQNKVNEFKLVEAENKFKSDLSKLGIFYDFDYPNTITRDKDNFLDPFHYNQSIANIVINEIVTGNIHYARKQ